MLDSGGWPTQDDGMASWVMLRWIMPVPGYGSSKDLVRATVSPAVRASGWLSSPGTTYHVTDRGDQVQLTVVTRVDDATDVQIELGELLQSPTTVETARDPLLRPDAAWYRAALQGVSRVGLDVIEARGHIPLSEYEAFERPADAALLLTGYLNRVSGSYRRSCSTYEKTESFWLSFFRRGPTPDLSQPGRGLWNLAG